MLKTRQHMWKSIQNHANTGKALESPRKILANPREIRIFRAQRGAKQFTFRFKSLGQSAFSAPHLCTSGSPPGGPESLCTSESRPVGIPTLQHNNKPRQMHRSGPADPDFRPPISLSNPKR